MTLWHGKIVLTASRWFYLVPFKVNTLKMYSMTFKEFEKISSPHIIRICLGVLRTLGFYINFRQLAINGHSYCVLTHTSPLSVQKHDLGRKCSLMATPSKRDSVNAQSSFKFRSVDSQILLSGKILRTGFPVQQFHICASRVFFNINGRQSH